MATKFNVHTSKMGSWFMGMVGLGCIALVIVGVIGWFVRGGEGWPSVLIAAGAVGWLGAAVVTVRGLAALVQQGLKK